MTKILKNWAIDNIKLSNPKRLFAFEPNLDKAPDVEYDPEATFTITGEEEANLVMSSTGLGDVHLPVLDLDVPHQLVASSTEGHSHLYINVPVSWNQYKKLLRLLQDMGILEPGYVAVSIKKGATMVRKPGQVKLNTREYH